MHTRTRVHMRARTHVPVHARIRTRVHTRAHTRAHIHTCARTCAHTCAHVRMHALPRNYTHAHPANRPCSQVHAHAQMCTLTPHTHARPCRLSRPCPVSLLAPTHVLAGTHPCRPGAPQAGCGEGAAGRRGRQAALGVLCAPRRWRVRAGQRQRGGLAPGAATGSEGCPAWGRPRVPGPTLTLTDRRPGSGSPPLRCCRAGALWGQEMREGRPCPAPRAGGPGSTDPLSSAERGPGCPSHRSAEARGWRLRGT